MIKTYTIQELVTYSMKPGPVASTRPGCLFLFCYAGYDQKVIDA